MDPLHPIIPGSPSVLPISAPVPVRALDRETRREKQAARERRQAGQARREPESADGVEDDRPHCDVTV
jgi:hypothetical protein